MKRLMLLTVAVIVLLGSVMLAGCKKDDRVNISSILENPGRYADREVVVAGVVSKTYSVDLLVAEAGAYQVDDGTGKIWVLTRAGVPEKGTKIGLKGSVSNGIRIGREVFGAVMHEQERRTR